MRVTVIGCSPAWPNPGEAQSGYLVEDGGTLLLDCGPGVLAKLRERDGGWPRVNSIVLTHWHLDHWGDVVPWVWGRMFGLGRDLPPPELWIPSDGFEELHAFGERFGTPGMFESTFELREYHEGQAFITAAGLEVTALLLPHYTIRTYGLRVTNGSRTLAYSGDSGPTDALAELARDADLFLCEATLAEGALDGEPRGHLSADEAVAAFRASGARRLILTHRPRELKLDSGLELATEGLEVEL